MTDLRQLIVQLVNCSVEFIIVGGAAAAAHGSTRLTEDLDIVKHSLQDIQALSAFKTI